MKRITSVVMALILLIALCACNNSDKNNIKVDHSVDVAKLAREGRIPEVEFIIGDSVDGVKDSLFQISAGMSHDDFVANMQEAGYAADGSEYSSYINIIEANGRTILSAADNKNNAVYCMYNTENAESGIGAIAVIGDAYGFSGNTELDYVKGSINEKFIESKAQSDQSFLPKSDDGAICLTYELGVYKLEFYFSSYNTLSATVLYNTEIWK